MSKVDACLFMHAYILTFHNHLKINNKFITNNNNNNNFFNKSKTNDR